MTNLRICAGVLDPLQTWKSAQQRKGTEVMMVTDKATGRSWHPKNLAPELRRWNLSGRCRTTLS